MNLIAKLLKIENVVVDLEASNKKRLFEQASLLFENYHGISKSTTYDALFAREKMGSTGLGLGIAIPHGRIKGLKDAIGALFRLSLPIPFDAPDGLPVGLVFVLLVPEAANDQHLQILSELAQMFSDTAFREQLLTASDAVAIHALIAQWQTTH